MLAVRKNSNERERWTIPVFCMQTACFISRVRLCLVRQHHADTIDDNAKIYYFVSVCGYFSSHSPRLTRAHTHTLALGAQSRTWCHLLVCGMGARVNLSIKNFSEYQMSQVGFAQRRSSNIELEPMARNRCSIDTELKLKYCPMNRGDLCVRWRLWASIKIE